MSTLTIMPRSRPLTRADLDAIPDDGHRYELIDGALIVTPAPSAPQQDAVLELAVLLRENCPAELKVMVALFDVALSDNTVMQPDVLVARRADLTERDLPVAPVLTVEVLSPGTRHIDLMLKRARYEVAGCGSYWVVDPIELSIVAWDLRDGSYVEAGSAKCDVEYAAVLPFPMTVRPSSLVA